MSDDYKICTECGSKMFPQNIHKTFRMRNGKDITIHDLKAYVCSKFMCDEIVFDDDSVRHIEEEILKNRGN